jgi:dihydroxy-acid dehydratase
VLVEAIKQRLKPRDIITRKSIENAIALVMATGGSTNAVLHYLAIALRGRGRMDDRRFRAHPQARAGAVRPEAVGRVRRRRLQRAGGVPQVLQDAARRGLLHGDCMTITGRTIGEELAAVPRRPRGPGRDPAVRQADVRAGPPRDPARQPRAGRLRREDHRPQEPGDHRPARVFDSEPACMEAIMARKIKRGDVIVIRYEGPKGGPACRRCSRRRRR